MNKIKVSMIITLPLIVGGCATTLPPAQQSEIMPERADAIWIHTEDTAEQAYRKIAQLITDRGFTINSSDAVLMNISTEYNQDTETFGDALVASKFSMSVNASIREQEGTVIKLTGKYKTSGMYGTSDEEVSNFGMKGAYTKRGWLILDEIAHSYSGGRLMYSRNL